jgi:hypothetical protein
MRNLALSAIALICSWFGAAHATTYVVDLTSTPYVHTGVPGDVFVGDNISFPGVFVTGGDKITINVHFASPVPIFTLGPTGGAAAFLNGFLKLDNNSGIAVYWNDIPTFSSNGFTIDGSAIQYRKFPDAGAGYDIHNVSFFFASAPEPSTWAVCLLGLAGVGAALRRRKLKALLAA